MKNLMLTAVALLALTACKKNETTAVTSTDDSMAMAAPADSSAMLPDSATMTSDQVTPANLSADDKTFADKAAIGGMMEVQAGQLAETNGMNAKVKAFGKRMVDDHTAVNNELKSWAASAGYSLPTALDAEAQSMLDELKAKKGADFDKAYIDHMVSDHKKDIDLFKKQASSGSDANLKGLASKTLPKLEEHLKMAEDTKSAVK